MFLLHLKETKKMDHWDAIKIALWTQCLDIVKLISVYCCIRWFENWRKTKKQSKD